MIHIVIAIALCLVSLASPVSADTVDLSTIRPYAKTAVPDGIVMYGGWMVYFTFTLSDGTKRYCEGRYTDRYGNRTVLWKECKTLAK